MAKSPKPDKAAKPAANGRPGEQGDKKDGKEKGKQGKKGKKANKGGGAPSIATHPRAGAQVRRAKGLGGLGCFALAAALSLKAGAAPFDVGARALAAGVAGYMVAWACSVTIWRHLVLAELRTLVESGTLVPDPKPPEDPAGEAGGAG